MRNGNSEQRGWAATLMLFFAVFLAACTPAMVQDENTATPTPEATIGATPVATAQATATTGVTPVATPQATATTGVTPTTVEETTPALTVVATPAPPTDVSEEAMTSSPPDATPPAGMERFIEQARQDLAQRLDVDPAEIAVESAEAVVWPDGSLGCPQPGMVYPQVLQDGYRILLRADDEVYAYHGGGAREPFFCEEEHRQEPLPSPGSQAGRHALRGPASREACAT